MLPRILGCFFVIACLGIGQITFSPQTAPFNAQQQSNANTKRYPVSGTVINSVTGAPVPRAVVRLQGTEPALTFTGDDGRFELMDVPEGRAFLSAQRPGFQVLNRGIQQVTVGSSTSSVQLKMVPQSSLRGRVRNTDGDPIEGLQIQAFRSQVINGVREWIPVNSVNADETGSYEIDDLAPGPYLLQTRPHRVFTGNNSVVVDGRHFPDLYPGQYYPNSPDRSSAQPIPIQPGTDAEADFTLSAVPSYTVSGSVANARNFGISCETSDGEPVSNGVRVDRNGAFTIMQLPAGPCTLRVRTGGQRGGGESGYAELPINIGASDITGLQLSLEPLPDIPLIISGNTAPANSGGASANNARNPGNVGANVQLVPRQSARNRGMLMLTQKGDSQVFTSVPPGNYRVVTQVFGASGTCLGSISSGSTDLLRSDLTVSPGGSAAPIDVVLRKDCGSLTAKVEGPDPGIPISLVLIPDAAPSQAKTVFVNGGTAQIPDLTPGDYTIYAPPDVNDFAYADPETLKGMQGQKVTIGPNAQASVQLQLPPAPGANQ